MTDDEIVPIDCAHTMRERERIRQRERLIEKYGEPDYSDPMTRKYGHPVDNV